MCVHILFPKPLRKTLPVLPKSWHIASEFACPYSRAVKSGVARRTIAGANKHQRDMILQPESIDWCVRKEATTCGRLCSRGT